MHELQHERRFEDGIDVVVRPPVLMRNVDVAVSKRLREWRCGSRDVSTVREPSRSV